MKKKLCLIMSIILLFSLAVFAACERPAEDGEVTISLNKTATTIEKGANETLIATKANTEDAVVWSSGTATVATVSDAGVVTAVAKGTAVITAAVGGKSAACTVTVADTAGDLAAALASAKTTAKGALDTLVGTLSYANYETADWTALQKALTDGKTAIDAATTAAAVTEAKDAAVAAINAVPTAAERITALESFILYEDQNPANNITFLTLVASIEANNSYLQSKYQAALRVFVTGDKGLGSNSTILQRNYSDELDLIADYLAINADNLQNIFASYVSRNYGSLMGVWDYINDTPEFIEALGSAYTAMEALSSMNEGSDYFSVVSEAAEGFNLDEFKFLSETEDSLFAYFMDWAESEGAETIADTYLMYAIFGSETSGSFVELLEALLDADEITMGQIEDIAELYGDLAVQIELLLSSSYATPADFESAVDALGSTYVLPIYMLLLGGPGESSIVITITFDFNGGTLMDGIWDEMFAAEGGEDFAMFAELFPEYFESTLKTTYNLTLIPTELGFGMTQYNLDMNDFESFLCLVFLTELIPVFMEEGIIEAPTGFVFDGWEDDAYDLLLNALSSLMVGEIYSEDGGATINYTYFDPSIGESGATVYFDIANLVLTATWIAE